MNKGLRFWWVFYLPQLSTKMVLQKYQQFKDAQVSKPILKELACRIPTYYS